MAKYNIIHSCGHTEEKQLFGKEVERQRYIAFAGKSGICTDCRAKDAAVACAAIEAEHELPTLRGSVKQVAWARGIRFKKITEAVKALDEITSHVPADRMEMYEEMRAAALQSLYSKTDCRYWIDARQSTGRDLAEAAYAETVR